MHDENPTQESNRQYTILRTPCNS